MNILGHMQNKHIRYDISKIPAKLMKTKSLKRFMSLKNMLCSIFFYCLLNGHSKRHSNY